MKSGIPWQVIGIGRQTRETAREAARRAGMYAPTVSQTDAVPPALPLVEDDTAHARFGGETPSALDQALDEIAERQRVLERTVPAEQKEIADCTRLAVEPLPRPCTQELSGLEQQLRQINSRIESLRQPCGLDQSVETLRDDLAEIGLMVQEALPRKALDALDAELRKISARLDQTRDRVADGGVLVAIERGLAEVRDALRVLTPAENLVDLARAVHMLANRIDAGGGIQDPSILRQVEEAIAGMRRSVAHVASSEALATLSDEVRALARKVDQAVAAAGTGVLANLEQRIATLADALEARNQRTLRVPDELEAVLKRLIDKIERLELTRVDPAGLQLVQDTLIHLVERLATIESAIRNRSAPPADVRPRPIATSAPNAPKPSTPLAAASQPDMQDALFSAGARWPSEPAASLVQTAAPPAPAPHRAIDPNLPPDHPMEPGLGIARLRHSGSPANRLAAAEAVLAGTRPSAAPEPGSKSSFIAAARRAAQAAEHDAPMRTEFAGPQEFASAASRLASRADAPRALIAGTASIVLVLVAMAVARTLLGVSDSTGMPGELRQAAVAPAAEVSLPGAASSDLPATTETASFLAPPSASAVDDRATPLAGGITVALAAPRPTNLAPPVASAAASSEITGAIVSPGKPAAGAISTRTAPAPAPAPAPAHGPSAVAAEQLPAAFSGSLRAAAGKGDPAAQYEIALRYAEARGVAQNLAEAASWFERAAKQGLAPAQFRLGALHEKGLGVKKDVELARRYYSAAGAAGNAKALHNLAVLHAEGVDGKPDYQTAARWFRKAADYGYSDSQYNLAVLHARGIGVERNMAEAYKWFALAAREGDAEAANRRDEIAARLDPRSLAAAMQAAQSWRPEPQPQAAVQVRTPPEGWDAPVPAAPGASGKRKPREAGSKLDLAPSPEAQ